MASSADLSRFFVDDDEETLSVLVSPKASTDLPGRLEGLVKRFQEDQDPTWDANWNAIVKSAQDLGFRLSYSNPTSWPASDTPASLPAAFESEDGKSHLKATAAVLSVSETRAVQLTLGALRSVASDKAHFQSLLGTQALLKKVMDYYFRQRVARLSVIAECLRAEQDEDSQNKHTIVGLLDALDGTSRDQGRNRGLYRNLLSAACQPDAALSLDQLLPAKDLRPAAPMSMQDTLDQPSEEMAWKQFIARAIEVKRGFAQRERLEALEALLVLLYERIQGGVSRSDFCLLLLGFQTSNSFFSDYPARGDDRASRRLSRIAGLIGAECMSFWRIFEVDSDDVTWVRTHPILVGVLENDKNAERELDALTLLLKRVANQSADRIIQRWSLGSDVSTVDAPESLAVLSYGLLLSIAHRTILSSSEGSRAEVFWQTFSSTGLELVELANSKCNGFDCLYHVMDFLVDTLEADDPDTQNGSTGEDSDKELDAASLAYASIGHEVLQAAIYAFKDTILSVDHTSSAENIGIVCNLASVTFRNSPLLCRRFWGNWDVYTSSEPGPSPSPLCLALDSAYSLAAAVLSHAQNAESETIIQAICPLLRLVSSLVYDADSTEAALSSILPPGLIRGAVELCYQSISRSGSDVFVRCRGIILNALCTLARMSNSRGRELLRASLEAEQSTCTLGPRLLLRLVSASTDNFTLAMVFSILSELMKDASAPWVLEVADSLKSMQDADDVWRGLFARENDSTQAVVKLVDRLVRNLSGVVFSRSVDDDAAVAFLGVAGAGVLSCSELLSASLSSTSKQLLGESLSYYSAKIILDCLGNVLKCVFLILELHESSRVRKVAREVRDKVVLAFVTDTGLGEAVMYYAVAPVCMNLAYSLEESLRDSQVLQLMATGEEGEEGSRSVFSIRASDPLEELLTGSQKYLADVISSIDSLVFDFEALGAHGWLREHDSANILGAALSAMRLLILWARHAEDISFAEGPGMDSLAPSEKTVGEISVFSPYRLLSNLALLPPSIRANRKLSSVWATSGVSNLSLLRRYLSMPDDQEVSLALTGASCDFVFVCLTHAKVTFNVDDAAGVLVSLIYHSSDFQGTVRKSIKNILDVAKTEGRDAAGMKTIDVCIRSLRATGACVDLNASIAAKILADDQTSLAPSLLGTVSEVITMLDRKKGEDLAQVLCDDFVLRKTKIAVGCLYIVRSAWKHAKSLQMDEASDSPVGRLRSIIGEEISLLSSLASFVFNSADIQATVVEQEAHALQRGRTTLLKFTTLALDVLSTEIAWVQAKSDRIDADLAVVRALEIATEKDMSRLVSASKQYLTIRSFTLFASRMRHFSPSVLGIDRAIRPIPANLVDLFTMAGSIVGDVLLGIDEYETSTAAQWVGSVLSQVMETQERVAGFLEIGLTHLLMSAELQRLKAWRRFSDFTVRLFRRWRRQSSMPSNLSMSEGSFSMAMAREVLSALHENTLLIERAQVDSSSSLASETSTMARTLTGMVLSFAFVEDSTFTIESKDWYKIMSLISKSSQKLYAITRAWSTTQETCYLVQQLLAAAAVILSCHVDESEMDKFDVRILKDDVHVELASTCCKLIRTLEPNAPSIHASARAGIRSVERRIYKNCFCTCVSLLAAVTTRAETNRSSGGKQSYLSKLHGVFVLFDVIRSLVWQVGGGASLPLQRSDEAGTSVEQETRVEAKDEIMSALNFFTAIAVGGDPSMLLLLASSEISMALSKTVVSFSFPSRGSPSYLRGYVAANEKQKSGSASRQDSTSSILAGRDDPAHEVWLAGMKFIAAALRSSRRLGLSENNATTHFVAIALDFLRTNHERILSSLKQCNNLTFESKSSMLTRNVVREATLILSIVSEMCSRTLVDLFKRTCPGVYGPIIRESTALVASLASFLGASGSSRELFRTMLEIEEGTVDPGEGNQLEALSPVYHILSSGVPNAKHEAIRYSHFISRCSAPITEDEHKLQSSFPVRWQTEAKTTSSGDAHSVSSLEHNCRSSVTNNFAFQLEQEAGACLFAAVDILWKTHPSASSFVMFSEEEASRLDAMPLVQIGMVIAFRMEDRDTMGWQPEEDRGKLQQSNRPIYFGRVQESDTLHRVWKVCLIGNLGNDGTQTCFVSDSQLAGLEDTSKRRCILNFSPAPETSSALEAAIGTISVGQFILALRWCHQTYIENQGQDPAAIAFISRLAELLTAFLGTEISIQQENTNQSGHSQADSTKILAAQLLDLYGDGHEFGGENAPVVFSRQHGRLKHILSLSAWNCIRRQLESYLQCASTDLAAKRSENRIHHAIEGSAWFAGGVRRSSSSPASPFRGLSF